jgi:hypothetical protein
MKSEMKENTLRPARLGMLWQSGGLAQMLVWGLRITILRSISNIKTLPIDPGFWGNRLSTYQDASRRCCTRWFWVRGTCDASNDLYIT